MLAFASIPFSHGLYPGMKGHHQHVVFIFLSLRIFITPPPLVIPIASSTDIFYEIQSK